MDLAQNLNIKVGTSGPISIRGPLVGINSLSDVVNVVMSFVYPFAGVVLLFVVISGAYDLITSNGSSEKVSSGTNKILAGVIGFILLSVSYIFVKVIGFIFGSGEGIL